MRASLVLLAAMVSVAYAVGQYYVPRSYYIIDSDGHETAPVPLRRLRRSLGPYPYGAGASATANANANAYGQGEATANANANAYAAGYGGGYASGLGLPGLGSSGPLRAGMTRRQYGPILGGGSGGGHSVSASTSVGMDSSGNGYYDQSTSVGN